VIGGTWKKSRRGKLGSDERRKEEGEREAR
jgi:hypothetical protein